MSTWQYTYTLFTHKKVSKMLATGMSVKQISLALKIYKPVVIEMRTYYERYLKQELARERTNL